jgi:hypothetical protein
MDNQTTENLGLTFVVNSVSLLTVIIWTHLRQFEAGNYRDKDSWK